MSTSPTLIVALVAALLFALGSVWFGKFELEIPKWRRSLKLVLTVAIPAALAASFGVGVALGLLAFVAAGGLSAHFLWCRKNGIDPWTAEPWPRYRQLRGWTTRTS